MDRDGVDRVGACLRSFDGIFEYDRDKEYFYLEYSIRLMCHNSTKKLTLFDPVGVCRISRLLANIQRILDEHGRQYAPKSRSSVRVDEDFWYMRGRYKLCTTNDEPTNQERRMAVFFDIPHTFGKCNTPKCQPEQDSVKRNVPSNQGGKLEKLVI